MNAPWLQPDVPTVPDRTIYKLLASLLLIGAIAYSNSLTKVYLLDDVLWISNNEAIKDFGEYVSAMRTRPVTAATLYGNYRIHGLNVFGYHLVNVAVHLAAALTLFGLVRRTLLLPRWGGRFAASAPWLAFAAALLWMVHPLQTQAVTYIIQRGESMMGLFFLLAMYSMARGTQSARPKLWYLGSWLCCVAGAGSKEVMAAVLPIMLCYDWIFVASWREIAVRRWWFYAGVAGIWAVPMLGSLFALSEASSGDSYGFKLEHIRPVDYWMTQAWVVLHYLRLCVVPYPQCFSYRGWVLTTDFADFWPAGLVIGLMLLATTWLFLRRHWIGFLGVCFFGVLSITSIIPLLDVAFEHRMYLPTAAVCVLFVCGGFSLLERFCTPRVALFAASTAVGVVAVALVLLTMRRNEDYRSISAMWMTVHELYPDNYEAINDVAVGLASDGKYDEAFKYFQMCKNTTPGWFYYGELLCKMEQPDRGLPYILATMKDQGKNPSDAQRYATRLNDLGRIYWVMGDTKSAEVTLRKAVKATPKRFEPPCALALVLNEQGSRDESAQYYRAAVDLNKDAPSLLRKKAIEFLHSPFLNTSWTRKEALFYALQAAQLTQYRDPATIETLLEVYAANKMHKEAIELATASLEGPAAQDRPEWQAGLRRAIGVYRQQQKQQENKK
jgi:tetratricopeptide (TPR) repeat protein